MKNIRYLALYDESGKGAGIVKCNDNQRLVDGFIQSGFVEIDKAEYSRIQRRLRREDDKAVKS
jgi:hypothetical protein